MHISMVSVKSGLLISASYVHYDKSFTSSRHAFNFDDYRYDYQILFWWSFRAITDYNYVCKPKGGNATPYYNVTICEKYTIFRNRTMRNNFLRTCTCTHVTTNTTIFSRLPRYPTVRFDQCFNTSLSRVSDLRVSM